MDILSTLIDAIQAELGPDIFTDARRAEFERALRVQAGGEKHYIASAAAFDRAARDRGIVRQLESGVSTTIVAERTGLTDRQVRRIRQCAIDAGAFSYSRDGRG